MEPELEEVPSLVTADSLVGACYQGNIQKVKQIVEQYPHYINEKEKCFVSLLFLFFFSSFFTYFTHRFEQHGNVALIEASLDETYIDIVKYLIEQGADMSIQNNVSNNISFFGLFMI